MNLRIRTDPVTIVMLVLLAGCLVVLGLEGVQRIRGAGPRPAATAPEAVPAADSPPAPSAPPADGPGGVG